MGCMSNAAINWCREKRCPNPTTKLVLVMLANYADERGQCYPSEKHLAEICCIAERSVRRSIANLADAGLITVRRRKGLTNLYQLAIPTQATSGRKVRPFLAANTLHTKRAARSLNDIAG